MVEINPQQVMVIAEGLIQDGWIQGKEKTMDGVCIVGALREAVRSTLRPQVEEMCLGLPEVLALPPNVRAAFISRLVRERENPLIDVFRSRFAQVLGPNRGIEGWNDASGRQKTQVLEAMRASLEIITQECVEAWDKSSETEREDALQAANAEASSLVSVGAVLQKGMIVGDE